MMFKTLKIFFLATAILQLHGCEKRTEEEVVKPLATGMWRGELIIQEQILPFLFEVSYEDNQPVIYLINASERLLIDSILIHNDSLLIPLHDFDARIRAALNDSTMEGVWQKNNKYAIPFSATLGKKDRFKPGEKPNADFSARWEMTFIHERTDTTKGIGVFKQQGNALSGRIITETGDYRLLSGNVSRDSLRLSTFNGDRAYLLTGKLENDTLKGNFWSGNQRHKSFYAIRNESIELPDSVSFKNNEAE